MIVRSIPAFGVVRASVGAWTSEDELERLVELVAAEARFERRVPCDSQPSRTRSGCV